MEFGHMYNINLYLLTFNSLLFDDIWPKPHVMKQWSSLLLNHVCDNSVRYSPKEWHDLLHDTNLFLWVVTQQGNRVGMEITKSVRSQMYA